MISFCINMFLRPMLEEDQPEEDLNSCKVRQSNVASNSNYWHLVDNIVDLSGPKLFGGTRHVLIYYQVVGLLNWIHAPLYVSLIYKIALILLASIVTIMRLMIPLMSLNLLDTVYTNPTFIFIFCLSVITSTAHFWLTIYINLFKLCPLFKIITTSKLCYISEQVQYVYGDGNLFLVFIFMVYNTCLVQMLVSTNYQQFLNDFSVGFFVLDLFSQTIIWYHIIGLEHYDSYIRYCFGSWIFGLKMNFESRFERFRIYHRIQLARCFNEYTERDDLDSKESHLLAQEDTIVERFITLDEIQNHLNNMDDHLEVWRTIQAYSLALTSVNGFVNNGTLLLFAYSLLANRANYYHGLVVLAIAVNYWIVLFFCYSGDEFVYYALRKFVQSVEDEYYLQGSNDGLDRLIFDYAEDEYQQLTESSSGEFNHELQSQLIVLTNKLIAQHKTLLVKKENVLFCHEFVHQFNNHLATPWSRLNFNSHLHMLGTFVTLIAAQILFDEDH